MNKEETIRKIELIIAGGGREPTHDTAVRIYYALEKAGWTPPQEVVKVSDGSTLFTGVPEKHYIQENRLMWQDPNAPPYDAYGKLVQLPSVDSPLLNKPVDPPNLAASIPLYGQLPP